MLDFKASYREMIEARTKRAAKSAAKFGFDFEIKGSLLEIFNEHAIATVLFRSDHIVLQQLHVDLRERRRNHGSAILEAVIAIANDAGLRLELIAEPPLHLHAADLSQRELQAWYRRHHFVDADDILMSRLPDHVTRGAPITALPVRSAHRSLRRSQFLPYARSGLQYSADAGAAFCSLALSFFSDCCGLGITAVDQWTQAYGRI